MMQQSVRWSARRVDGWHKWSPIDSRVFDRLGLNSPWESASIISRAGALHHRGYARAETYSKRNSHGSRLDYSTIYHHKSFSRDQSHSSLSYRARCSSSKPSKEDKDDESHDTQQHIMTIPNVITISRMIASPWIGSLIIGQDYDLALAACFAVGLSDFADGYIARTFHSKSILGSYLDPLSDKVFITTLYSALGYMSHIPFGVVFVVVGRDILQIGLTLAYKHKEIAQMLLHANTSMHKNAFGKQEQKRQSLKPLSLPVTTISKVNTTAQIGFALLSLLNLSPMCMEYGLQLSAYTMDVMGNMVILSTVMAGSSYVWLKSRAKQTP